MATQAGSTGRPPTLRDVAKAAGVSSATAGRALAGYGNVRPELAVRVQAAARDLDYHPNALARSMRERRSQTFGFVGADIENTFFARVVRGITDVASEHGIELIITNTDEDQEAERKKVSMLLDKQVDGLIVAPAVGSNSDHLLSVLRRGVPLVLLDRSAPEVDADCVLIDGTKAGAQAADHLVSLGHEDVAIVSETPEALADQLLADPDRWDRAASLNLRQSAARLLGFLRTMKAAGVELRRENVLSANGYSADRAHAVVLQRFAERPPSALFATDYVMTTASYRALLDLGIAVPATVSFVGFDDLEWTSLINPPLTVISQPVYRLGQLAADRLLARVNGDSSPSVRITPDTQLLLRRSTAPRR